MVELRAALDERRIDSRGPRRALVKRLTRALEATSTGNSEQQKHLNQKRSQNDGGGVTAAKKKRSDAGDATQAKRGAKECSASHSKRQRRPPRRMDL